MEDRRKNSGIFEIHMYHVLFVIFMIVVVNIFLWMYLQRKTRRESSNDLN